MRKRAAVIRLSRHAFGQRLFTETKCKTRWVWCCVMLFLSPGHEAKRRRCLHILSLSFSPLAVEAETTAASPDVANELFAAATAASAAVGHTTRGRPVLYTLFKSALRPARRTTSIAPSSRYLNDIYRQTWRTLQLCADVLTFFLPCCFTNSPSPFHVSASSIGPTSQ